MQSNVHWFSFFLIGASSVHSWSKIDSLINLLGWIESSCHSSTGTNTRNKISEGSLMPFSLLQGRWVIYAADQMQSNSIHALKSLSFQSFFNSVGDRDYRSLLYGRLIWKKQPPVITVFVLRMAHDVTKPILDFCGVLVRKGKVYPQTHMSSDRVSYISHGDFTHQYAASFVENNWRTWFHRDSNPRAMFQLQLPFHSVELSLHDGSLSIYRPHAISGTFNGFFGFVSLQSNKNESQSSNNNEPPFGPFEGGVPLWRVMVGVCGMVVDAVIIICSRRKSILIFGALLILTGTLIWLTGHYSCDEEHPEQDAQHVIEKSHLSHPNFQGQYLVRVFRESEPRDYDREFYKGFR